MDVVSTISHPPVLGLLVYMYFGEGLRRHLVFLFFVNLLTLPIYHQMMPSLWECEGVACACACQQKLLCCWMGGCRARLAVGGPVAQ